MRVLLTLRSLKDSAYDKAYYNKLRGLFYNLQKGSKYFNKHNNEGYRFYSFSNVFPAKDVKFGEKRNLIVSSPDNDFIHWMYGKIALIKENQEPLNIGESQFEIQKLSFLNPKIRNKTNLITGTPIVMRIPQKMYDTYGIKSSRPYEFWKPEHDFNAFVVQLSSNLIKKYNQYYEENLREKNVFEVFKFKKPVCVHRIEEGREIKTIGSIWEFGFNYLDQEQRGILWLGLESGFGELNSSGFGFMNVVKNEASR